MSKTRLLAGAFALAFVFVIAHVIPGGRPIYDGACVPDPYRYLNPPVGISNPGTPGSATKTDSGEQVDTIHYLSTSEQPPQAQFEMASEVLKLPAGTTQITLDLHAVPAPSVPANGPIQGNVYSATVTANGTLLELLPGKNFDVELTAPKSRPTIVVEEFVNGKWQQLSTESNLECSGDGYAGSPTQFGLFALVDPTLGSSGDPNNGSTPGSGSDSGVGLPLPLLGAMLLVMVAGFVLRNLLRRSA